MAWSHLVARGLVSHLGESVASRTEAFAKESVRVIRFFDRPFSAELGDQPVSIEILRGPSQRELVQALVPESVAERWVLNWIPFEVSVTSLFTGSRLLYVCMIGLMHAVHDDGARYGREWLLTGRMPDQAHTYVTGCYGADPPHGELTWTPVQNVKLGIPT